MSLHVIKAGFATTIQDLGRFGFQSNGVPIGGAMDEHFLLSLGCFHGDVQRDFIAYHGRVFTDAKIGALDFCAGIKTC